MKNKIMKAAKYKVTWDGKNTTGLEAATGMYFVNLKVGNKVKIRKMILLK